jgi:hypothetical protein
VQNPACRQADSKRGVSCREQAELDRRQSKNDGTFILRVLVHADYIWIECEDAGGPWHIPDDDGRPHGLDVVHALCGEGECPAPGP